MFTPKPPTKATTMLNETSTRQTTVSKRRLLELSIQTNDHPSPIIQYTTPTQKLNLKATNLPANLTPSLMSSHQTPRKLNQQVEKFMTPSARNAINHLHSHSTQHSLASVIVHTKTQALECQLNSDLPINIQTYLCQRGILHSLMQFNTFTDTITTPIASHLHHSNYHAITTNERCFVFIKVIYINPLYILQFSLFTFYRSHLELLLHFGKNSEYQKLANVLLFRLFLL